MFFGYIREYTGDSTDLIYLRARFYMPNNGSFITRDPSELDSNLFSYASANPINRIDPRGLDAGLTGPAAFSFCIGLHTGLQGNVPLLTAGAAVSICRSGFRKDLWTDIPFNLGEDLPTSAHNLFGRFLFESGDDNWLFFDATEPLTHELTRGTLVNDIRNWFYSGGDPGVYTYPRYIGGDTSEPIRYNFGLFEYLGTGYFDSAYSIGKASLPLEFVMGSFHFQVKTLNIAGEKRVGFRIDNDMTMESGTHIVGRMPPEYQGSVEDFIKARPGLANRSLAEVVNMTAPWGTKVISILSSHPRGNLDAAYGGGSLFQTFTWTERYDPCLAGHYPEEIAALQLGVNNWTGWEDATVWPKPPFPPRLTTGR